MKTTASVKRDIENLRKERDVIYSKTLKGIDEKIEANHTWIKQNCRHIEDNLIASVEYHSDEYGKTMDSWTTYEIECSVCGRSVSINKSKMDKTNLTLQDVVGMCEDELKAKGL